MKNILLFTIIANLFACSFGGFKPPIKTAYWDIKVWPKDYTVEKYVKKQHKDMRTCGIDPVVGEHLSAKQGLCMEAKGWYWTDGPVCEEYESRKQEPLCKDYWRAKMGSSNSLPNMKK